MIKGSRYFLGNRPNHQDIQIIKVKIRICNKIFVADIAAAKNSGNIVDRKRFIVGTSCLFPEAGNKLEQPRGVSSEGIKNPDFHILKGINNCKFSILSFQSHIIKQ